jgi:hypothetical protein
MKDLTAAAVWAAVRCLTDGSAEEDKLKEANFETILQILANRDEWLKTTCIPYYTAVPSQQDRPIIYVPPYGLMEWVASSGIYRSVDCGQVILHSAATPKPGTISASGDLLSKTTYAGLWSRAQADGTVVAAGNWQAGTLRYEDVDAAYFRSPQLGAEFFRAWDNGRGVDAGRLFGSWQADQMQRLIGYLAMAGLRNGSLFRTVTGVFTTPTSFGGSAPISGETFSNGEHEAYNGR